MEKFINPMTGRSVRADFEEPGYFRAHLPQFQNIPIMEYRKIQYSDLCAEISVSAFKPDGGIGEYHIIISITDPCLPYPRQVANVAEAFDRTVAMLPANAETVFRRYFLSDIANQLPLIPVHDTCATSVVGQPPLNGTKIAMWAVVQEDMTIERISPSSISATHGSYRHLWSGNITVDGQDTRKATIDILDHYANMLSEQSSSLTNNCVRTWFFVDDVDFNYAGVVKGRNEVFGRSGLTPESHFIASTGICGRPANPRARVAFDAYSIEGIQPEQITYLKASTHLNPTYEYGVAFERGTAIDYADRRHVLISGTASINNKGEILHPGDITAQTLRMLENVGALLSEADCNEGDITHYLVYLRDPADYTVVSRILDERLPSVPKVILLAPVCRSGWLVEMECSAIRQSISQFPSL